MTSLDDLRRKLEGEPRFRKRTKLKDGTVVSTVWIGVPDYAPFETLVWGPDGREQARRIWATHSDALEGHRLMVRKLRGDVRGDTVSLHFRGSGTVRCLCKDCWPTRTSEGTA